ncbi:MAG: flagellin lysine-N-methylase [Oscillospiraceae bacterium]|nr:flagellin lysine-N-methylase [Oscillospiraceae bacterium]
MRYLRPKWAGRFACAASACPDSCCRAGWEIIPDGETLRRYESLPGPVGERIRAGIAFPPRGSWHRASPASPEDAACGGGHWPPETPNDADCRGGHWPPEVQEEPLLRQDENRVCVLLDPDGLCCVQRSFGHGALCRVCREYPRFHREFGALTELGLSLSCPTAYALAVGEAPAWEEWEDEAPPVPNELDPEAYLRLRKGRDLALELLAREELPLSRRLELLRRLAAAMQAAQERRIKHDYDVRLRRWSTLPTQRRSQGVAGICLRANAALPKGGQAMLVPAQFSNAGRLARRFLELEILSPAWKDALERFLALAEAGRLPDGLPEDPEPYARWLWNQLYKYWLDALEDGNLLGRVDRSLDMLRLGMAMDRALPGEGPFLRRMSREIEHCEENLAALLGQDP